MSRLHLKIKLIKLFFKLHFPLFFLKRISYAIDYIIWLILKRNPPHIVKLLVVKHYAKKNKIRIFVETGTYLGEMVNAVKNEFQKIYTIELNHKLFLKAKNKFKEYKHIGVIEGDSSEKISGILSEINEPCLFWLDGHFSGGFSSKGLKSTPILEELKHIFNHPINNHVILIDDARYFIGKNDYPTLKKIKDLILSRYPKWTVEVKEDIIRAYSPGYKSIVKKI